MKSNISKAKQKSFDNEYLTSVIVKPVISEKSTEAAKEARLVFKVLKSASKVEVKAALKFLFDIEVNKINSLNVKGKTKRRGKILGKRQDWKKVYVRLKNPEQIQDLGLQTPIEE